MKKIILFLILTQSIISCSNDTSEKKENDIDITTGKYFAVGSKYGKNKENNFSYMASIWVDGVPVILSDKGSSSTANAIAFYNNDTYIAGTESLQNGNDILKLWKNNVAESLTDGKHHVEAADIAINQRDVYIVGNEYIGSLNTSIATVWKNGTPIRLSDEISEANAISIHNNEMYIAGYKEYYGKKTAIVWKLNGSETFLYTEKDDLESTASDIYVDESGIYVTGYLRNSGKSAAILWKNTVATRLSDENSFSEARTLFVHNGDVYVCGYDIDIHKYDFTGKIWKNGSLVKEMNNAKPESVSIKDNKILIGGIGLGERKVSHEAKIWDSDINNLNSVQQHGFGADKINAVLIK